MYNLNIMANTLYLNKPVAETKANAAATNPVLLKQEAPKDSFEYTYDDAPEKTTLQKVAENLNPVKLASNAIYGVKNLVAHQLFLKKDDAAEEVPAQEKSVFQKVADGIKNFIAYQLFLKK